MLLFQAGLSIASFWLPHAWVMATFYAPFIIPAAITLYLGDTISDVYIKNTSTRDSSS